MQPARGPAHVALPEDRLEQDEEIEVRTGEIHFIQHVDEIISLDSDRLGGHVEAGGRNGMMTRRDMLLGAAAGATPASVGGEEMAVLVERTRASEIAFVRGEMDRYLSLISHADDYTLMSPFGESLAVASTPLRRASRS
jgi:hypothetical protein